MKVRTRELFDDDADFGAVCAIAQIHIPPGDAGRAAHPSGDQGSGSVEAAVSGMALAYVWEHRARPHLARGELVECLASWCAPEDWLYIYYPTRKHISAGLRADVEALRV